MFANNTTKTTTLWCALAYAYLRLAYELLFNSAHSTSVFYLLGMMVGMHGLQYWLSRTAKQPDQKSMAADNAQTIALAIICIALLMDAARCTLELLS